MTWTEYLFSFEGRINRQRYWQFVLLAIIAIVLLASVLLTPIFIFPPRTANASPFAIGWAIFAGLAGLAFLLVYIVAALGIYVRRLHDRDKSAWWLLPFVIAPGIVRVVANLVMTDPSPGGKGIGAILALLSFGLSIWAFVEIGCLRGTAGANRFGPDPLGSPEEAAAVFT